MTRLLTAALLCSLLLACNRPGNEISLAGKWDLCLDSVGDLHSIDPDRLPFDRSVFLPGTLDSAGIGDPVPPDTVLARKVMLHLKRKVSYIGPAYYRKTVNIPGSWKGKIISLQLERVIWESVVWIDGKKAGNNLSLSTPHDYDLTGFLKPGRHTIIICIDNSRKHLLNRADMAHAYTEETQIKWNGILGKLSLKSANPSHLGTIDVYPDFAGKSLTGKVNTLLDGNGSFVLDMRVSDPGGKQVANATFPVTGSSTGFRMELPADIRPWNEFSPERYEVEISLIDQNSEIQDVAARSFGFRDLGTRDGHLYLNGERLFLRGTLECCIFPLTGHPPVDQDGWENVYRAARSYGLNHLRFHSWCPPEAAFEVADRMGFYLQVELPNWSLDFGRDTAMTGFINREADQILASYGNHPSFCFLSMGNELEGDYQLLTGLVGRLQKQDPRHLYTTTTYTFQKGHGLFPEPADDFYVTQNTEKGWIRGQGVFDQNQPDFRTDYSQSINHIGIPVISHEIGQYSVFPPMNEIEKYTGVLVPENFMAIQKDLKRKGISERQAGLYTAATGKFATILYKEEIERALKTDGLSGFQLLDLHDFPGQGTALVGVLDAFWESKGFVSGDEWSRFGGEVVPLIWFDKAVYTSAETFGASFGVANYYRDFDHAGVRWRITGLDGTLHYQDSLSFARIPKGEAGRLGNFTFPLHNLPVPARYLVEVSITGTRYENQWSIWVYPPDIQVPESDVRITGSFFEAIEALEAGENVLLNPGPDEMAGITGKFVPVFWSPVHFPDQPGTMGILVDPRHPALKDFPTEFHSDWQWWDLCKNSKTLVLDGLTVDPIVTVIDNFFKNRRLGNVFEANVGGGKLLFCSIDLHNRLEERPVARQLKQSLLAYMNSDAFKPSSGITSGDLITLQARPGD